MRRCFSTREKKSDFQSVRESTTSTRCRTSTTSYAYLKTAYLPQHSSSHFPAVTPSCTLLWWSRAYSRSPQPLMSFRHPSVACYPAPKEHSPMFILGMKYCIAKFLRLGAPPGTTISEQKLLHLFFTAGRNFFRSEVVWSVLLQANLEYHGLYLSIGTIWYAGRYSSSEHF